jgi:hypothetical protein
MLSTSVTLAALAAAASAMTRGMLPAGSSSMTLAAATTSMTARRSFVVPRRVAIADQHVAGAAHGLEQLGAAAVAAQLGAQP